MTVNGWGWDAWRAFQAALMPLLLTAQHTTQTVHLEKKKAVIGRRRHCVSSTTSYDVESWLAYVVSCGLLYDDPYRSFWFPLGITPNLVVNVLYIKTSSYWYIRQFARRNSQPINSLSPAQMHGWRNQCIFGDPIIWIASKHLLDLNELRITES